MKKLSIIKIGGNLIDNESLLNNFLNDFAQMDGLKILVHGGGKLATQLADKLGIKTEMHQGRRITSSENRDVVTMVYAGLINKKMVANLQAKNCNAVGLSGADANCILSQKRPVKSIDYGWVGDVEQINISFIKLMLENEFVPVFCAITHDGKRNLLNTNADTVAAELAMAMSKDFDTKLIYSLDKKGVLADVNDNNSTIKSINLEQYQALKLNGTINKGMLPKLENCFRALANNVSIVRIGDGDVLKEDSELFTSLIRK
jgi:acetylglutamate kinase